MESLQIHKNSSAARETIWDRLLEFYGKEAELLEDYKDHKELFARISLKSEPKVTP